MNNLNNGGPPRSLAELKQLQDSTRSKTKRQRSNRQRRPLPAKEPERSLEQMRRWSADRGPDDTWTFVPAPSPSDDVDLVAILDELKDRITSIGLTPRGLLRVSRDHGSIDEPTRRAIVENSAEIAAELARYHACKCPGSFRAFLLDKDTRPRCSSCHRALRRRRK